jgi:HD-like signal output (HDOD) protein
MKRILFVDDEAMVLQGLQRMLRGMRSEWDMVFAESGALALDLMEKSAFDVVVSDMRMPGMNGAALLAEVMTRFPKTIRLILSGHADQDLILKCIGSTHQYLSKPCEPDALKAAILRAFELEKSLQNPKLRELAARMDSLPSVPSLYTKIVQKLRDPEVGLDEIGQIIGQDLAMTAKILKLVNSSFFGLRRRVSNPTEAVSFIGLDTMKSLVLCIHAFSQFDHATLGNFSIEQMWTHSQETGSLAKQIARLEQADTQTIDEAFVAGLLHDTGKLILAANFPEQYGQISEARRLGRMPLQAAETEAFGADHAIVGGYLLGLWGLPVPVVEAITFHHCPEKGPHKFFGPLTAVYAANILVHIPDRTERTSFDLVGDLDYLGSLGLADRLPIWNRATLPQRNNEVINA